MMGFLGKKYLNNDKYRHSFRQQIHNNDDIINITFVFAYEIKIEYLIFVSRDKMGFIDKKN